jgi:hypothetical protein
VAHGLPSSRTLVNGDIPQFLKATHAPGQRIDLAKKVQQRAINPMLSECLELEIPARIKPINGLNQTDGAGLNKVIKINLRATPVQAPREQLDLRHVVENEHLAVKYRSHLDLLSVVEGPP